MGEAAKILSQNCNHKAEVRGKNHVTEELWLAELMEFDEGLMDRLAHSSGYTKGKITAKTLTNVIDTKRLGPVVPVVPSVRKQIWPPQAPKLIEGETVY